jgi:uncharacterized protein
MASRQFLKILQSARVGDASAQQNLAFAYLTGAFKTPIQPANALIWLEKSYFSYKNQLLENESLSIPDLRSIEAVAPAILEVFELLESLPLKDTLFSSAFPFGWNTFWEVANSNIVSADAARWQLADLMLNPVHQDAQTELQHWLNKQDPQADYFSLQEKARVFLDDLANSETKYTSLAKALLIQLQPKDQALSSLWELWVSENNGDALIQAAEEGLTIARLTMGMRLARMDGTTHLEKNGKQKSNASLKKAAYWLELAAKDGDRDAWFALGEIYRRPQFSGYNAAESDKCFDRAADLGHAQAQFRKGSNLWRRREKLEERVQGLQASYWIWQAHQQDISEASEMLSKILIQTADPSRNNWYEQAIRAEHVLNRHAEYQLEEEWAMMCHRLVIANQFNLTKAELLLCEIAQLQHEHCVVVDIRHELPKILPKLIQINTTQQRRTLLAAGKVFASSKEDQEGNLRQRRYRFDRVTEWLDKIKIA